VARLLLRRGRADDYCMTIEWPTLAFGVLFILASGWMLLVAPAQYQATRQLPGWMLPVSRLWPASRDILVTRIVAGLLASFGVLLLVGAFLV
jgi:hypothetical protein